MTTGTMKAVVFDGPYKVSIQERPIPTIKEQTDIIVKVDKVCELCRIHTITLTLSRQHYAAGTVFTMS